MKTKILVITKKIKLKEDVIKTLESDFLVYIADFNSYEKILKENTILCILDCTEDYDTLRKLKSDEISELIPVIIISNLIEHKMVREYLNLGAYDFVELPFDKKTLNLRIKDAVNTVSYPKSLMNRPSLDRLCDIYNAETFFIEVRKELDNRKNNDHFFLVRFDINKFTMINYFFGVKYGENILKFIAKTLSNESLIYNICYGRMSKDIFGILFNGSENELDEFVASIKKIVKSFNPDYDIELTFGVYEIFDYDVDIQQMLSYATLAAKTIKGIIGPSYIKYNEEMRNELALEQSYVSSFESALANHEFIIYLQPKYDLIMEKIIGAEALVRWGKNGTIISPGEFIPIFERNGLIEKLDKYVWEETVKYIRWRMDNNLPIFGISVNVSRIFLSMNNFIDDIVNLVNKYDIPTRYLELEITESIFSDVALIKDTVKKLRDRGFKILMDDFGSGYSGLNVLKDVEFDALKIDLKFFSRNDKKSQDIIKSVLTIAHAIDIPAIAEGVETAEYVELLKKYGCNYAQGFYYSKPLPIDEFNKLCDKDCIYDNTLDKNKYLNIYRIENIISEFVEYAKDYSMVNDSDINALLEKFRAELNVDNVYINIASAEGDKCIFTNCAAIKEEYNLNGKIIPVTLEQYASQCMLFDEDGLSEVPGVSLNEKRYKSILYYGLTRGNHTDGSVGMISYKKLRKWTLEEKKALKMLGRCIHLLVYRKRNEIIREANAKKERKLRDAYNELARAHAENDNTLTLMLSALKDIPVRLVKYNFNRNQGCYYKPINNKPFMVKDDHAFDTLCDFFNSAIEKPNVDFRSLVENLEPDETRAFEIKSYECLGKIEPDNFVHSTSIRIQVFDESGEKILVALLIDNSELIKANQQGVVEANKLRELLVSILTNEFVDLTTIDLNTKQIYKFSAKDNQIFGREINTDWEKLTKTEIGFIVEDDIREQVFRDLSFDSLTKLKPYEPKTYRYKSWYESKDEPRSFQMECKVIINSDHSKVAVVYTTEITKYVALENRLKNRIKDLEKIAGLDTLTDIHNRMGLEMNLENVAKLAKKEDKQYLLLLDADFFKDINDKFGHLEGDKALKNIGNVLMTMCEKYSAFAYRYGGDEFVLIINLDRNININTVIEEINVGLNNISQKYEINMTVGVAKALYDRISNLTLDYVNELIELADFDLRSKKEKKKIGR